MDIPNRSWHNWMLPSDQIKRFGRTISSTGDFVAGMNGDYSAQNVSILGAYNNAANTVGFYFASNVTGLYRINWLVVMAR